MHSFQQPVQGATCIITWTKMPKGSFIGRLTGQPEFSVTFSTSIQDKAATKAARTLKPYLFKSPQQMLFFKQNHTLKIP
ncbi:hypothetical protein EBB79_04135 [Parasedimentitalea marina]|uniref:Uncharacterized protein n=1 Tax=Parasedimentitalea marina TaxID=2483033 RepID=A0A3T0MZJ4_9RHOB|nr:hypothetical protein EBB79_04135 [Parasedimentitalea marina]